MPDVDHGTSERTDHAPASSDGIIDLEAANPQIAQFLAHAQMLGMRGIGLQSGAIGEFGEQHDVAGIVDVTDIKPDFDMGETVNAAFQSLKQGLDL